jgi:hypothetical protein
MADALPPPSLALIESGGGARCGSNAIVSGVIAEEDEFVRISSEFILLEHFYAFIIVPNILYKFQTYSAIIFLK